MDRKRPVHQVINRRRLYKLLNDGLSAFFGAYYTPWNWWCNLENPDEEIYTQTSIKRSEELLVDAIEKHSGMNKEDAVLYFGLMLETINSGKNSSTLEGFVESIRGTCRLFGDGEEHHPDFPSRSRQAAVAAITALLLDDGELTGKFKESCERHWTAEENIDAGMFAD